MPFDHTPVLLDECLQGLNIRPDGTYMDGKRIPAGVDVPFHRGHKLGIGSAEDQVFTLHSLH